MAEMKKPTSLVRAFRLSSVWVFRHGQQETADVYDVTRNSGGRLTAEIAVADLRAGAPQPGEVVAIQSRQSHGAYVVKAEVLECRQDEGVEIILKPRGEIERIQRRQHFRVALRIPVKIKHPGDEPVELTTEDVSAGGLRVVYPREIAVGDPLHITLASTEDGLTVMCNAHVRRCRPSEDGQFELGIAFARLRASDEDRLVQVLTAAARRSLNL